MSSAETLNFGPQWLRDLSTGGSKGSSTTLPSSLCQPISRFKLAENRYGREEMLALFVKDDDIPEELHRAPSLLYEEPQLPLALIPTNDTAPVQQPNGYRGRGGITTSMRSRPPPTRGRGRGRGISWDEYDDFHPRKPPMLRRAESEDWRSDALRGKGDGVEDMVNGMKEWRISGQRRETWRDSGWRDKPSDGRETVKPFRNRSLSAKEGHEPWADEFLDADDRPDSSNTVKKPPANLRQSRRMTEGLPAHAEEKDPGPPLKPEKEDPEPAPDKSKAMETGSNKDLEEALPPDSHPDNNLGLNGSMLSDPTENLLPPHQTDTKIVEAIATCAPIGDILSVSPAAMPSLSNTMHDSSLGLSRQELDSAITTEHFSQPSPILQAAISQSDSMSGGSSQMTNQSQTTPSPMTKLQQLATTWYYKDPQGDTQGPFSSSQMMDWFNAGYFTMVLLVRRACDPNFVALGDLIKKLSYIPFQGPVQSTLLDQLIGQKKTSELAGQDLLRQQYFSQQQQLKQQDIVKWSFQQARPGFDPTITQPDDIFSQGQQFHQQQQFTQKQMGNLQSNTSTNSAIPGNHFERNSSEKDFQDLLGAREREKQELQRKLLLEQENRRKEEERIQRILKEQEEQKELLRRQEEELRRKEEQLRREAEEIKRRQLEAQEKQLQLEQHEAMQRRLKEEEEKRRHQEEMKNKLRLEEEARRQRDEYERRKLEEEKRLRMMLEKKRQEEAARQQEEGRKLEETRRIEEVRRQEIEREERRKAELLQEETRQQKLAEEKEQEERRKKELLKQQRAKEQEAKRQKKIKEEQMMQQTPQLPSTVQWAQTQQQQNNTSLSLLEIQQIQEQNEHARRKQEEELHVKLGIQQQQTKPKSGWGATIQAPQRMSGGLSLLEIQQEEERQMARTRQAPKVEVQPQHVRDLGFNTSWNKPPKIQPDAMKTKPKSQPKKSESFWDQVMEENTPSTRPAKQTKQANNQAKPNNTKGKKTKGDEETKVKALFQQQTSTRDTFMEWCDNYLQRMNAGHIDIPTFVNFLRDVQSGSEVEEYVQSYLGETRDAREFARLFLEKRHKPADSHRITPEHQASSKNSSSQDSEGFRVVTGNSKRSKKKQKKSQKVDPRLLGFSVNAASDRVNMGEIESVND